ncbi:DNA/RNA non-specific endonuclease [Mesorhizobium sp. M0036]|uniref:DNA/RNA non-specific endonuclease n=1 Tax=Mesorhizobium sp. M0036 TaxID=2956853 RepID=UPI003334D4EB
MSGKLTLSVPESLGISDARVSILDHNLAIVSETTLSQPAGSIDLAPGIYAARALLRDGTLLETAFQMPESGENAEVVLSQARVGALQVTEADDSVSARVVASRFEANANVLESIGLESAPAPGPRELTLISIDFDGRTSVGRQKLLPDASGWVTIPGSLEPCFVRIEGNDGRYSYVAAPVSASETARISPAMAPGNFEVKLQDPDADLFIRYLEGGRIEQLSLISDYWRKAKDLLSDKHEFPVAAAVGAYVMMLVGPPDGRDNESTSPGNWLDRWTETLYRATPWLADGLCIRAEVLARRGEHRDALDLLYELPSRGLPMFTPGLRFALDRLSGYRNAAAGGRFEPADGEKIGAVLDRLYQTASNANFDRPVLNFREPAGVWANRKVAGTAATPSYRRQTVVRRESENVMGKIQEQLARLRRFNASVRAGDLQLAEESADLGAQNEALEIVQSPEALDQAVELESIVMRRERPVLAVQNNATKLIFIDKADSEIWEARLTKAKPLLDKAIRAVGRINLVGGQLDWVGTGWLVAENVLVTNRHVALEFAGRKGAGFTFKMGVSAPMEASTDFLEEIENPDQLLFKLVKPLHIEDASGHDVAFFEIEMISGEAKLANPIDLAADITRTENVATIGYPAYDSRIPEPDLMERIYGKVYNKKRLAPGGVTRVESTRIWHNCTTLGGNSGSLVFDLDKGHAVGLHFSGSFLATNYAVRSDVVKKLLDDVRAGRVPRRAETPARDARPASPPRRRPSAVVGQRVSGNSLTIPLTLRISVELDRGGPMAPVSARGRVTDSGADDSDMIDDGTESVADYRDRGGYDPAFLGQEFNVDMPAVIRDADDILDFQEQGGSRTELRYEHYSVIMSRSRRMCFLSACNIDGNQSKKSGRVAWKWDPRIPRQQQIMKECYGSPPKFSRGHMTRREDPGWGAPETAKRGNEDSMHVTNVTPQMQAFNAPIWLALEDYALQHARGDAMKISVFTGAYFAESDPEMYGVRIPLAFWKVIAFIHDDTGKLCATGYEMDQQQSLRPEEEFVFGAFTSPQLGTAAQVSIRSIEARSGINFGRLAAVDPLAGDEESVSGAGPFAPLLAMEQIRFVR